MEKKKSLYLFAMLISKTKEEQNQKTWLPMFPYSARYDLQLKFSICCFIWIYAIHSLKIQKMVSCNFLSNKSKNKKNANKFKNQKKCFITIFK